MSTDVPGDSAPRTPPVVCYVLQAFAVAVAVITIVAFFVGLADVSRLPDGMPGAGRLIFVAIAALVVGLAAAAALVGLAEMVRHLDRAGAALERMDRGASPPPRVDSAPVPPVAAPPPPVFDKTQLDALQRLLEEIRDNVLLTEEERRTKHQRLVAMERRERTVHIQRAVEAGQFHQARQLLLEFERRVGGDEDTRQIAEFIENAARQAEEEDVAAAAKHCEDLMSLTSWDRAMKTAEDLIDRHPNSLPARQLLARVQREKQVHQQEHRNRLFLEIQRHTSSREWRAALSAAEQLIAAYPDSMEAETLRGQMNTLKTNAEIEHRRQMEAQYKSYIDEHRFSEALALARDVVRLYPESPQGKVLREQIPHLEKRVQNEFGRSR